MNTVPSGAATLSGLNQPSLEGDWGSTIALKTVFTAETSAEREQLTGP